MRALVALVLAFAATAVARAASAETLAAARQRGELVWGGDLQGGEPYVFEDPKDPSHVVGFEVDIAAALARELGLRAARFSQVQWSNLVPTLERGDIDVAMNGLEDTPERRTRLRLSRPYFVFHEVLTVRKGAAYRSLDDLHGKRVGTLNETYALQLLQKKPVEPVLYEGQEEPYFDLQQGRVDAVFLDHIIADRYGCPLEGLECVKAEQPSGKYVIGMRKDDAALAQAVDEGLGRIIESGELRRILEKWHLWDDTQADLAKAPPPTEGAEVTAAAPSGAASFDRNQIVLFLQGAGMTILISIAAFAIAMPLGVLLAATRVASSPFLGGLAAAYVEVMRGTPVLLQLYVLYFGLAPVFKLGPLSAATLGLGLNYAAYEAEVYRGALMAVPRGQSEAAAALGFRPWQTLRHVLLPQALRTALPAVTNDFVSLLKDSSLVSVLTVVELTKRMTIAAVEMRSWLGPGLVCAALYFAMSFPLSRLSRRLEGRLEHDPHPRVA
jgi:polar amino acid transport system substrate-binding protein